jgi:hypothetical protein
MISELRQRLRGNSDADFAIRMAFLLIVALVVALVWFLPG